ncbi:MULTISPECIES: entericidin A/B family lipoprotein [Halomonadaceae]|uniref:Entericidin A/B family lipoprotein n=1 Tax=Modicisalibacter zincidurans TaxID=1178777 RepID=A0ABP9R573_9GAMM|nr:MULTISPECIES: entericidin A/B family lipoprotein [Halomonas]MCD6008636.1 entericidin A/B family lipoprotein [Halomonas sp. IOP_31]MEA3251558.1 entericidin A/B family lipoprotein [Pseudomonadota bacterium]
MKKLTAMMFLMLMAAGTLAGCNTLEGAGEDIEQGGEEIQEEAS